MRGAKKCQCPGVITGLRGSGREGNIRGQRLYGSTGGGMCQPGAVANRPEKICTPESSPARGRDRTVRGVHFDTSTGQFTSQAEYRGFADGDFQPAEAAVRGRDDAAAATGDKDDGSGRMGGGRLGRRQALRCQCPGVITSLRGSGWEGNIRSHQPDGSTSGG